MQTTQPIPIAIVLNTFEAGGTEHQMTELLCLMNGDRFAVHAVCIGERGPLRARVAAAGIPITAFPLRGLASASAATQVLRFVRWSHERRIQVVHACDFYANAFALPAAALARVPVRIGSRRDIFVPERTPGQFRLQRFAYRCAHRIVANSAAARERLIHEGVRPARIVQIANGLRLDDFAAAAPCTRPRIVTTVANLRPGKGHDVLLDAATRVIARFPDVHFRIVGDGPRRQELQRRARQLGIMGNVEFRGHTDDVPGALRESHIFAFPSLMEASPNAVLEAMAAGLPIVATRVGGIPEVLEHEHNGLLVPASDAEALASAVIRLMDHPDLCVTLAAAARQTAVAGFSFARMTTEFEALYLAELARRAPRQPLEWAATSGH